MRISTLLLSLTTATSASAIPPALPPSGPISGRADCLFEQLQEAGQAYFNEAGLPPRGMLSLGGEKDEPQIRFIQFPVDGSKLTDVEFGVGGTITLHAEDDRKVVGEFTPLHKILDDRWWMNFSVPGSDGDMIAIGKCLVDVGGSLERPIRLTEILTTRVD